VLDERHTDSPPAGNRETAGQRREPATEAPPKRQPEVERPVQSPEAPAESEPRQAPHGDQPGRDGERDEGEGEQPKEDGAQKGQDASARKPHSRRRLVIAAAALVLILGAPAGYLYWDETSHFESTDDAFIAARQFSIAPQVSGYVVAVPITDNEHVNKDTVIARIDPRNYNAALEQAQAQVAAGEAGIKNSDAQIAVQEAQIASNQAQVTQAQASLVFAQEQAARFQALVRTGAGTVENAQQSVSQQNQQQAALASAKATLALAERQIDTLKAQRANAEANLKQAEAQRDQAELNVSHTTVRADQPGRVANLTAGVGEYATAGTALTMFVPDDIWVVANFKETQLDAMRPGQPVTMEIDAYPERTIHGHVASVQPGSGTAFSLLPAENATGNYVKIVQRVPVKIVMDNPPTDIALGPGMSVAPTVRTNPAPSLWERLKVRLPPSVGSRL
jgi:membrane fusion protein (multidrug efflux system)